LEEEEDCFLLLVVLNSIRQRDDVSLVLRLEVLAGKSAGRMMVGREVQNMLLSLMVGKMGY
jgi:hypothetical protein